MRRARKNFSKAAIASAAVTALGLSSTLMAATLTWTGTTRDPNSPLYTLSTQGTSYGALTAGQNLYLWTTNVPNWTSAGSAVNYTVGDDVVFTDNFAGGTAIRASSSNMNPASMTFTHVGAGSTTYTFIGADFLDGTNGTGGAPPSLGANTPFGTNHSTVLTLDTGFN